LASVILEDISEFRFIKDKNSKKTARFVTKGPYALICA